MSKKIRTIIIAVAVLLVMTGITIALLMMKKNKDDGENKPIDVDIITLIKEDPYSLEFAEIKNETGEYVIEKTAERQWRIKELEDIIQMDYMYTETIAEISSVNALSIIEENCGNLDKFGLNTPVATLHSKYANGKEYKVALGATSPDGSTQYATFNDGNTVYAFTPSTLDNVLKPMGEYVDLTLIPPIDTSNGKAPPVVNYMSVKRPDLKVPIEIKSKSKEELDNMKVAQAYIEITSPQYGMINESVAQDLVFGNFGLSAIGIQKTKPTKEDLKEYGFDNPTSEFVLTYDETSTIKIKTGKAIASKTDPNTVESFYVMKEGVDQIYIATAVSIPWLKMQPNSVLSSFIVLPYIGDLTGFEIKSNGLDTKIDLANASENDIKGITAKVNGKDADMGNIRNILGLINMTYAEDFAYEKPSGDPITTITYKYKNGKTDVVKVYIDANGKETVSLNDSSFYKCRGGFIQKVDEEVRKLLDGKQVSQEW